MFAAGDKIVYGGVGICQVESVGPLPDKKAGLDPQRLYYTLRPLHDNGVVYTPVDTSVFMRPVISRQQATELLDHLPEYTAMECSGGDYRQQVQQYREALKTHRTDELVRLLKALWLRQCRCRAQGKTLGKVDRQFQQTAEKFLYEELSCVLDIPTDQVQERVRSSLSQTAAV